MWDEVYNEIVFLNNCTVYKNYFCLALWLGHNKAHMSFICKYSSFSSWNNYVVENLTNATAFKMSEYEV